MKKVMGIIGAGALTASLVCGATAAPAAHRASAVISNDQFTVSVSSWFLTYGQKATPGYTQFEDVVNAAYKRLYPNATVQWDLAGGASYLPKLTAELATGSADDVIWTQGSLDGTHGGKAGYFQDLSKLPVMAKIPNAKAYAFTTSYGGKTYAIPYNVDAFGVFYNKALFKKAGIAAVPATWTQFIAAADKLKAAGIAPIAGGFGDPWVPQLAFLCTATDNATAAYKDPISWGAQAQRGRISLDGPPLFNALLDYQVLQDKGYYPKDDLTTHGAALYQRLAQGRYGMDIDGDWTPGGMVGNDVAVGPNIGYFPLPSSTAKTVVPISPGALIAVNAKSKRLAEADNLVGVLMSDAAVAAIDVNAPLHGFTSPAPKGLLPVYAELNHYLSTLSPAPLATGFISGSAMTAINKLLTSVLSGQAVTQDQLHATLQEANKANQLDKATVILPPGY